MSNSKDLAREIEEQLMRRYGPLLSGAALTAALGYPSQEAFRQACTKGTVPVAVFPIERRRGKYALCSEVAVWLAEQRLRARTSRGDRALKATRSQALEEV